MDKKRKLFSNFTYFLVTLICISPIALYWIVYQQINSKIVSKNRTEKSWKLYVGDKFISVIDLPKDLNGLIENKRHSKIVLEKRISKRVLDTLESPSFLVGRVGDSDLVEINGCEIGRTGFSPDLGKKQWWWGKLRIYKVPQGCIDIVQDDYFDVKLTLARWGIANIGVYDGPFGFAEYDEVYMKSRVMDFVRFDIMWVFSLVLLMISLYYFFVYIQVPEKIANGSFALFAFSGAFFEFFVSAAPYRLFDNTSLILKLNFLGAALASLSFLLFFKTKFSLPSLNIKIIDGGLIVSALFLIFGFSLSDINQIYAVYTTWFPVFLILFFISVVFVLRECFKDFSDKSFRFIISGIIFILFCFHDVRVAMILTVSPYLVPYGFLTMIVTTSLTLAEEYAEAYLYVEDQVKARTRDLATALDQLRSLEEMKERFFANISHDFKTPIAVAMGSLEEIKTSRKDGDAKVEQKAFFSAERSLNQLIKMVGDLLDVSKADSGDLKMQWVSAPLKDLLEDWTSQYDVLCRQKGLTLKVDTEGYDGLQVPMDVGKMERVIQNLLSNAVKFTQKNPGSQNEIRVLLRSDDSRAHIMIEDSGIGIPAEERDQIFDRYFQSSRTSLREHGGSGIGLSFVKEIVDLHYGKIRVEVSDLGGSKFTVSLPLSQDLDVLGDFTLEERMKAQVKGSLDVSYPPTQPHQEVLGAEKILLAEDNPEIAQVIYQALDSYNVYFARDGVQALDLLQEHEFDCLVTDIVMPNLRGDELVERLRSISKFRDLPILILSSHSDEKTISKLLNQGANDYVTKPFRREILQARVRSQIQTQKISRWISQNEKVIEVGLLANGMAHQIRNGLNGLKNQVLYQSDLAEKLLAEASQLPTDEFQKLERRLGQSKEIIHRALERIEGLTASINTYTLGSKDRIEINLIDTVELVLTLLQEEIQQSSVEVRVSDRIKGLKIMGYTAIQEVLVNLIGNSIDACSKDGQGLVEIYGEEKGDFVEIKISDNGVGISPEVLPKLCQPFFSTKPPGQGTGLGLYIVRDIVEGQHGGKFIIESKGVGKGATCTVRVAKVAPESHSNPEFVLHGVNV